MPNVHLTPQMQEFAEREIATGAFANLSEVVRAGIGFDLTCSSGIRVDLDRYRGLVLHRNGRFSSTYANLRSNTLPDGGYFVSGGSLAGRLNRARTAISGTVSLNYTRHDAAGAVTDSCDSGRVKYTAK